MKFIDHIGIREGFLGVFVESCRDPKISLRRKL
jgi:hypothetical protein